jgi:hypothetical protein
MNLGLPKGLQPNSYLELEAVVRTGQVGGILFDRYAANDYKFVVLDVPNQKVLVGHVEPRRGWVVDASLAKTLVANTDYTLHLTMRGPTVTVDLNGAFVATSSYNGIAVDGAFGLLSSNGATSFDNVRVRTNDPAFGGQNLSAATPVAAPAGTVQALAPSQLELVAAEAERRWSATTPGADLPNVTYVLQDLPGLVLGRTVGDTVQIDPTAAGYGWFVDATPWEDSEFAFRPDEGVRLAIDSTPAHGRMDLLTVLLHELGHVLGLEDLDQEEYHHELLAEALAAGVRRLPVEVTSAVVATTVASGSAPKADESEVGHAALTRSESRARATTVGLVVPLTRQVSPDPRRPDTPGSLPGSDALPRVSGPRRLIRVSISPPRPELIDVILAGLYEQPSILDPYQLVRARINRTRKR